MRYILAFIFPATILGFRDQLLFSIDYFKERQVQFVCVVNCENDSYWSKEFAKSASNHSIATSSFKTKGDEWRQDMERCFLQKYYVIGVIVKTACGYIGNVLLTASENMWFDAQHVWLVMEENNHNVSDINNLNTSYDNNGSKVLKIMEHLNISVDADIKMGVCTGILQYHLLDIFNLGKPQGGTLKIVSGEASWNLVSGFSANLNEYKYYKRWDFGQWPMRVASVTLLPQNEYDPSILLSVEPVRGVTPFMRTSNIILMVVAEVHNIKFVYSNSDRWISNFKRNDTKIYNCVIEKVKAAANSLYFREQDVTAALRIFTKYTYKIGFILPALASIETKYYYKIPTTGPGRYENQFLRPLSAGAWQCTMGVAVLCVLILIAAARLEQRPSSVQYALFSVTANICQQFFEEDLQTRRTSAARKLTIFITGLSGVLIYNYYTSSVVSWLLNGPPPSINNQYELLASPLELIFEDVGYTRSWLSNPGSYYYNLRNTEIEDKIRHKILTKKKESILMPLEEGIAMVKAGGYAYHTETDDANQLISNTFTQSELCELGSVQCMDKTLLYPGVQMDSPYKEFLTWSLTRLLERGIVSCVQRRTTIRLVSCEGSSPRALALGGAAPAFIMLVLGFLISTAIMLFERCLLHYINSTRIT